MPVTIAVANQKGGVGKTTSAVTLSHFWANHGKQVLLIDFDMQGHVSTSLRFEKSDSLYRLLVDHTPLEQVAIEARPGLSIVPNDKTNEKVIAHMMQMPFREFSISNMLEQAQYYDLVILDMPPSTNVLHIASLVAADYVIIPAKMDYLALEGVMEALRTIRSLGSIPGVVPPILIGILPTMYDRTTRETAENLVRLRDAIGSNQILPPIPKDTRIREASSRGMTIWEYAQNSPSAIGYQEYGKVRNSLDRIGGYLHLAEITSMMIW